MLYYDSIKILHIFLKLFTKKIKLLELVYKEIF